MTNIVMPIQLRLGAFDAWRKSVVSPTDPVRLVSPINVTIKVKNISDKEILCARYTVSGLPHIAC
jgi:hypothetical protein